MTRRTLTIVIDANRVTCGKCVWVTAVRRAHACNPSATCMLFCDYLPGYKRATAANGLFRRCAPCLAAEREAGG